MPGRGPCSSSSVSVMPGVGRCPPTCTGVVGPTCTYQRILILSILFIYTTATTHTAAAAGAVVSAVSTRNLQKPMSPPFTSSSSSSLPESSSSAVSSGVMTPSVAGGGVKMIAADMALGVKGKWLPGINKDKLSARHRRYKRNSWWSKKSAASGTRIMAPTTIITDARGRPLESSGRQSVIELTGTDAGGSVQQHADDGYTGGCSNGDCIDFDLNSTIYCYTTRCVPRFVECFTYATAKKLRVRCKLALHICRMKCHQNYTSGAGTASRRTGAQPGPPRLYY